MSLELYCLLPRLWTTLCILAKVNSSERHWIVLADVKLLGRTGVFIWFVGVLCFAFRESAENEEKHSIK